MVKSFSLSGLGVLVASTRLLAGPVAADVAFKGAGDFELRGTVVMPDGAAAGGVPAVLLLPGSGPTDRNGNQPPYLMTDLLRQIAERLAAEGIASLRFDKRAAHVYAPQWPEGDAGLDAFFSYENFIGDATAAYHVLRGHEGVDGRRVAILGHSEGGLFALQIGRDLAGADERPAGLILAATAGRVLDEVVREQIRAALEKQTTDQGLRDSYMDHLERGITAIRDRKPLPTDTPPGLAPILNRSALRLLHAYFTIDPAALAADVRGPVLVLQGQRDAQVSAERDAPLLEAALRKRAGAPVRLVVIPDASHNFKETRDIAAPTFTGPVVPTALEAISAWCRDNLGER